MCSTKSTHSEAVPRPEEDAQWDMAVRPTVAQRAIRNCHWPGAYNGKGVWIPAGGAILAILSFLSKNRIKF